MKLKQKNQKENYLSLLLEKLKIVNPYRIILFGSYACGKPTEDSDIDLIVVTNNAFIPKNYKKRWMYT